MEMVGRHLKNPSLISDHYSYYSLVQLSHQNETVALLEVQLVSCLLNTQTLISHPYYHFVHFSYQYYLVLFTDIQFVSGILNKHLTCNLDRLYDDISCLFLHVSHIASTLFLNCTIMHDSFKLLFYHVDILFFSRR